MNSTNKIIPNYTLSIKEQGLSSQIKDLPINFLFKDHDGEWLSLELEKNQIDNFLSVYGLNNPKTIKERLQQDLKKKINNQIIPESDNSYILTKAENFEILSNYENQIRKSLYLLEQMKNRFRNYFNSDIERIFSEFKSSILEVKQEEEDREMRVEFSLIHLKTETNENFNSPINSVNSPINSIPLEYIPIDLNSNFYKFSAQMSNIMMTHINSENEQNLLSIPNQNFENYYIPDSNQNDIMYKSINLLSPVTSEDFVSNLIFSNQNEISNLNSPIQKAPFKIYKNEPKSIENFIHTFFDFSEFNFYSKKFYRVCIECNKTYMIKDFSNCCDNFICKFCVSKNFSHLVEILGKNICINVDCFSCYNKFYFCKFCLILDLKENLIKCDSHLCNCLFHLNCYKMMKILGLGNSFQISEKNKFEFYKNFSNSFVKDYYLRENEMDDENELLKKINRISLENYDRSFLMILYKINSIQFFKFFNKIFTQEVIKNKNLIVNNNFENLCNSNDKNYCHKHSCFNCFKMIDNFLNDEENTICICCNNLHLNCNEDLKNNENVKFNLSKNITDKSPHIPLLHLKFYRENYLLIKKAVKDLIIVIDKKKLNLNFPDPNSININKIYKISKESSNLETISENSNLIQNINLPINILNYEKLNEKENKEMKILIKKFMISSNVTRIAEKLNYLNYPNNSEKGHCECMKEIVEKFEFGKNIKIINNYHIYNSKQNFKNFVKNNNFIICGDFCTNRINRIECNSSNCYGSENLCKNRYKYQKNYSDNFTIVKSYKHEYGLISNKNYNRGEFIMEIFGEIIDDEIYSKKLNKNGNLYWFTKKYNLLINQNGKISKLFLYFNRRGNFSKFLNHSCKSNSEIQIWEGESPIKHIPKKSKVYKGKIYHKFLIFAKEEILINDEFTIDYNNFINNYDSYQGIKHKFQCKCQEICENNKKFIGENIKCEILKEIPNYENKFKKIFFKDNFKRFSMIFNFGFNKYDYKVMRFSQIFNLKNVLLSKRKILSKVFNEFSSVKDYYKENVKKLEKFFGFSICGGCNEKIKENVNFCIKCWKSYHINCTNNSKYKEELICNKCKCESGSRNEINNFNNVNKIYVKFYKEKIITTFTKLIGDTNYICHVYEILINENILNEKIKLYSIFYEYKINSNFCNILSKKFIIQESQYLKIKDEFSTRNFNSLTKKLFEELLVNLNKI